MVCSRGFPVKAFSGMASMLLLWKPLEDKPVSEDTETQGTPCNCRRETVTKAGTAKGRTGGNRPPSFSHISVSLCLSPALAHLYKSMGKDPQ